MKGADPARWPREALLPVPGDDRARDAELCEILYVGSANEELEIVV